MQLVMLNLQQSENYFKFLGKDFWLNLLMATFATFKSTLGIDVEKEFEPKYIIPMKARKVVKT